MVNWHARVASAVSSALPALGVGFLALRDGPR